MDFDAKVLERHCSVSEAVPAWNENWNDLGTGVCKMLKSLKTSWNGGWNELQKEGIFNPSYLEWNVPSLYYV
jgi:hypothetical protein